MSLFADNLVIYGRCRIHLVFGVVFGVETVSHHKALSEIQSVLVMRAAGIQARKTEPLF